MHFVAPFDHVPNPLLALMSSGHLVAHQVAINVACQLEIWHLYTDELQHHVIITN